MRAGKGDRGTAAGPWTLPGNVDWTHLWVQWRYCRCFIMGADMLRFVCRKDAGYACRKNQLVEVRKGSRECS